MSVPGPRLGLMPIITTTIRGDSSLRRKLETSMCFCKSVFFLISSFYLLQDNSDVLEVEIHIKLFSVLFRFIYIVSQNLIFPCQDSLLDSFELSVTRGKYWS